MNDTALSDLTVMLQGVQGFADNIGCGNLCLRKGVPVFCRIMLKGCVTEAFIEDWNRRVVSNSSLTA